MIQRSRGFTIVEIVVVVVVIAILAAITFLGFGRYQASARDSARVSKATILAEALEKYYDKNGEYPSCPSITASGSTVTTNTLPGVDAQVLLTPTSSSSTTNSIQCTDLTSTSADIFAYVGDGSTACATGQSCLSWTLKYIDEETGVVNTITSRRNTNIATSGTSTLTTSGTGFTQVNASWTPIDNAVNYDIQRSTDSGFTTNLATQTVAGTSTSLTGLAYNTQYYLRVRATVAGSQGNWSPTKTASTWSLATPTLAASPTDFTSINTSWAAIPNATGYEVQRASDAGFTTNLTTQALATTASPFTGLTYNTQYYFRVRATVASGQSSWSTAQPASTWVVGTPSLSAVTNSSTVFTSSWTAGAHATSYALQLSSDGTTWSTGWQATTASTAYSAGGATQGYKYYVRVQASNGSYTSSWSNIASTVTSIDNPAAFPLYSTNTLPNWNYLNVGSGVSCPAGTSPSSDWYANGSYWLTGGVSQSYGLGWNTSVTISVASRCTSANTTSGFVWASNTASMDLPWSSVWIANTSYRHLDWGATCPKWTTSSSYDWWVKGNNGTWGAGENGIQYTSYDNQGIAWGNGDARVAIHCWGPWGGDARSDGWGDFGPGCMPTITSSWCTY